MQARVHVYSCGRRGDVSWNKVRVRSWRHGSDGVGSYCNRMDGSTGPPSDVTAMGSENDEGSKAQRDIDDTVTSVSSKSVTSTYSMTQSDQPTEYRGQDSIRAGSTSPHPTTSPSSSSSSSSSPPLSSSLSLLPPLQPGCGCVAATVLGSDEVTISITPTTGGQFDLTVDRTDTIENLKKLISKRLKVSKERICLLHRERQLREGTLEENRLQDGSRLTLLPSVETGLLMVRLESLFSPRRRCARNRSRSKRQKTCAKSGSGQTPLAPLFVYHRVT